MKHIMFCDFCDKVATKTTKVCKSLDDLDHCKQITNEEYESLMKYLEPGRERE